MAAEKCKNCKNCCKLRVFKRIIKKNVTEGGNPRLDIVSKPEEYVQSLGCNANPSGTIQEVRPNGSCEMFSPKEK